MNDKQILKAFQKARKKERERAVVRPTFTLFRELFLLICGTVICAAVMIASAVLHHKMSVVLLVITPLIFVVTQAKNILLLSIFLYQRYAPASVRIVCLFTPSCSEYMRLSVLKYGVCSGFIKGLRRVRRCHPPNGGIDEP